VPIEKRIELLTNGLWGIVIRVNDPAATLFAASNNDHLGLIQVGKVFIIDSDDLSYLSIFVTFIE
jgi:hypothetical protein